MNEATRQGDPWLTRAVVFVDGHIPFPDWVQERQRELTRLGLSAPRRLAGLEVSTGE